MFDSKARGDAGHRMVERCDPRGEGYGRALYASRAVMKICFFQGKFWPDAFWRILIFWWEFGKSRGNLSKNHPALDFDGP